MDEDSTPAARPMMPAGEAYDRVADDYDGAYVGALELAENRVILELLRSSRVLDGGVVADVGCGTGLLLELLGLPPERYVGLDIAPRMLEVARRKFPAHRFVRSDLAHPWPTFPRVQAVVSLFSAFSYLDAPAAVARMADALGPGGRFFVMLYGRPRASKILARHGFTVEQRVDSPASARTLWGGPCWTGVTVRGFSALRLPSAAWLRLETATLTRAAPRAGRYLIVEGSRTPFLDATGLSPAGVGE